MLEGITILNETPIYVTYPNLTAFIISIVITCILGFCIGFSQFNDIGDGMLGGLAGIMAGIFIGMMASGLFAQPTDKINYIEYKVTIDDNVSFTEFNNKYKIIEKDGAIYTIKERKE